MMILRSAMPSPFGRKVKLAAAILGLSDRIEIVMTDTLDPADPIRQQNPLGKIPALILETGEVLFDSRVIVEYLDSLAGGGKIIPASGPARFRALTQQALADGICDAAILQMYEIRFREAEIRSAKWVEHQAGKVARALEVAEKNPPAGGAMDIGVIAMATALGYLDLRFGGEWRKGHPRLVAFLDRFAASVPTFEATKVKA